MRARLHAAVFNHPASASDLRNFYRAIQALSADSWIDGRAIAMV